MKIQQQIDSHLESLPQPKQNEMRQLHDFLIEILPGTRLWFDEGKNDEGKVVANPTIGYGFQVLKYAKGKTRDFFQIGLSANTTGISVYILGLKDKTYLAKTYSESLGKAKITGYCIKFKSPKDIDLEVLKAAVLFGVADSSED